MIGTLVAQYVLDGCLAMIHRTRGSGRRGDVHRPHALVLIVLMAALLIGGCRSFVDPPLRPGWTRLVAEEPALSVDVPPGWIRDEDAGAMTLLLVHAEAEGGGFGIDVLADAPSGSDEWQRWVEEELAPDLADGRLIDLPAGQALYFHGDRFGDHAFLRHPDGPVLQIGFSKIGGGRMDPDIVGQILETLRFR